MKNIQEMITASKESVKTITPHQLHEIQTYYQPPQRIKFCLEAVFFLLRKKLLDWNEILHEMNNGKFMQEIYNIDINKIDPKTLQIL